MAVGITDWVTMEDDDTKPEDVAPAENSELRTRSEVA